MDAIVLFLIEWFCFWRAEHRNDDAPEGVRPPRWLRVLVFVLALGGIAAAVVFLTG